MVNLGSAQKFIGLGAAALRNNVAPLRRPYKLNFSITYWCQSRCTICNIWQLKPKNELGLDEIREFAAKNPFFKWIGVTGGEPFMRSDIVDVIGSFAEHSKKLYIVTIPTNSLCNTETVLGKVEEILKLGIPKLSITLSLDGHKELHDKLRGVPGNFDRVMLLAKGLRELRKRYSNLFYIFGYTMSQYNQGALQQTYNEVNSALGNVRHNSFHINVAQISDIYYNNTGTKLVSEREPLANELAEFIKHREAEFGAIPMLEGVFLRKLVNYVRTGKPPIRSRSLDASLFLDSYGNVFPSIMWNRKIGSIRESSYSLDPIWKSQAAREARDMIKRGQDPPSWTACEAYQSIVSNAPSFASLLWK